MKLMKMTFLIALYLCLNSKVSMSHPSLDLINCQMQNGESFFVSFKDNTISYYDKFLKLNFIKIENTNVEFDDGHYVARLQLSNDLSLTIDHNLPNEKISARLGKTNDLKNHVNGVCVEVNPIDLYPN